MMLTTILLDAMPGVPRFMQGQIEVEEHENC